MKRKGFSLVELLIALAIILAIVAIATGIFQPLVAEQQVDVLKANLRSVRQALLEFYNDHSRYPFEGQDEFGNVVTFLDDNTSELVQGRHSGQGTYPDQEPDGRKYPRRRYLMNMPGDPTLESNQIGWKLIFRETFDINTIARDELVGVPPLKKPGISGFEGSLGDWIVTNRPFAGEVALVNRLPDELKPAWGQAYSRHDVRFVRPGSPQPLRVRMVIDVKSLNTNFGEL